MNYTEYKRFADELEKSAVQDDLNKEWKQTMQDLGIERIE